MPADVNPLRKIIQLEQEKGFSDSVVIGGLDKFLQNWANPALQSISNPRLASRFRRLHLNDSHYASLSISQRKKWVTSVLNLLNEMENGEQEKIKTPAKQVTSKPSTKRKPPETTGLSIDAPITAVKGISSSLATRFGKMEVDRIRDLLYLFPNRHVDYSQTKTVSQLEQGTEETIIANVWQAQEIKPGGRRSTEAIVGDETGNVRVVWFNNPYLARQLKPNTRIVLSGRVAVFNGRYVFESPEWESIEDKELVHTGRLVPIYPLTRGLYPRQVRKIMKEVIDTWVPQVEDFLPLEIKESCHLLALPEAISQAHYPDDTTLKDRARIRLAFDELFLLQLGVLTKKRHWQEDQPGNPFSINTTVLNTFLESLPFTLTSAQQKSLKELLTDLKESRPMSRLLQGDVGSGKTVVATAGLLMATANNHQGAFMAPTEILAEQHFNTICQLLSGIGQLEEQDKYIRSYNGLLDHPLKVALLIGDIPNASKQELHRLILDGDIDIIIGTHALIQKEVEFKSLGLIVIDEQHRFGVEQRSVLRQKGFNPHVLVMTATPIPRTLALTLYGDLDLSVINELPPGRLTIKTKWLKTTQRNSAYNFIRREITAGRQAFIICPLIEESEAIQARAAVAEHERLSREVFPDLNLGLLHGRLSSTEKDDVMRRFRNGEFNILVSTSVIEVGIDVPNATVMMVESADRFGLSQLHQFRGRVGRGTEQSYCMLIAQNPSEIGRQRLDIIENTQDGFQLAEEDLKLRGPGEFFGTRQSGIPDLLMAKISDVALLELARSEAEKIFARDKTLQKPEYVPLTRELARVWTSEGGEWS